MQIDWILPKDRLPEHGQIVLTLDSRIHGAIFVNTFMSTPERGEHWIDQSGHVFWSGVSYWMVLQEPPRH